MRAEPIDFFFRNRPISYLKHILSFPDRLAQEAERLRGEAEKLPPGHEREILLRKARQADTASHINEWLTSPGLREPT